METLSVREAADRLHISQRTILNLIDRGRFPGAYKLDPGGLRSPYRIPLADVESFEHQRRDGLHVEA